MCLQFGEWHPLADLGMEAWPALRELDLSGCKDGVWEELQNPDEDFANPVVYALQYWLRNSPALESLDVSRSIGMFEERLERCKLFRALDAAPATLSSLWMTDLGMTNALFKELVHVSEVMRMVNFFSPRRAREYVLLPGLRFLDVSGNPLGKEALFVLAGTDPALALFMGLEELVIRDSGLRFSIHDDIPRMFVAFGKLRVMEVFPIDIHMDLAMSLMLGMSETTRVPSTVSAEDMAVSIARCAGEIVVPWRGYFKETTTVTVVHNDQGDGLRFQIPSYAARDLRLLTSSCPCMMAARA